MRRMMMYFLILISGLAFLFTLFTAVYIIRDRSFDECSSILKNSIPNGRDNKLKVGIVGDSWVAGRQLDQIVSNELVSAGIQAEVISSGQPGAVSRQVYRNLTTDAPVAYSCKHILDDQKTKYLVVIAGINDTVEHIGKDFYAYHMLCIIKAAQMRNIHPLVLEIPEYGIEITPPKSFLNFSKRLIYRMLFDSNKNRVILEYRDALKEHLTPEIIKRMSILNFSNLTDNYYDSLELYENPNHLNENGYIKLGRMISQAIVGMETQRCED